jgi:hypothetical protein
LNKSDPLFLILNLFVIGWCRICGRFVLLFYDSMMNLKGSFQSTTIMISKRILTIAIATVTILLGSAISPAMAGISESWGYVNSATAEQNGDSLKLSVTTGADIPRFPDSFVNTEWVLATGFAWVDLDTGKVVISAIHPNIGRDSNQNPDAWHIHPGVLGDEGQSTDFCVISLGTAQGGLVIKDNTQSVNVNADQAGVTLDELDVGVGYVVVEDNDCNTNLGVFLTGPTRALT